MFFRKPLVLVGLLVLATTVGATTAGAGRDRARAEHDCGESGGRERQRLGSEQRDHVRLLGARKDAAAAPGARRPPS